MDVARNVVLALLDIAAFLSARHVAEQGFSEMAYGITIVALLSMMFHGIYVIFSLRKFPRDYLVVTTLTDMYYVASVIISVGYMLAALLVSSELIVVSVVGLLATRIVDRQSGTPVMALVDSAVVTMWVHCIPHYIAWSSHEVFPETVPRQCSKDHRIRYEEVSRCIMVVFTIAWVTIEPFLFRLHAMDNAARAARQ